MVKGIERINLADYKKDPNFELWYCYMEDKWLQNADLGEKLTALFGSVKNGIKRYETYLTKEGTYLGS
jgi:hypothetical protein